MKFLRIFGIPILALLIFGGAGLLIFLSIPTLVIANSIGFNFKEVHREKSPDAKYQLVVTKRVAFPANAVIDPAVIARFELQNCQTGDLLDSTEVYIEEYGDLFVPKTRWENKKVFLFDFDESRKYTINIGEL